jgi:hypothetical protein
MGIYGLLIGILAVWRITHLLNAEDGPADIVYLVRKKMGSGFWGKLMDCFYCLSLWIAIPFAVLIGEHWGERALLWPGLSGGAILLERFASRPGNQPPVVFREDLETENGMLRQEERKPERPA